MSLRERKSERGRVRSRPRLLIPARTSYLYLREYNVYIYGGGKLPPAATDRVSPRYIKPPIYTYN